VKRADVSSESHPLAPLLTPRSIALVGASPKAGSVGRGMIDAIGRGAYRGTIWLVNPNYPEIEGLPCFPSIAALPGAPDHVVLGVANARLEGTLAEAIAKGAKAATIFASGFLPDDVEPPLLDRLKRRARDAGIAVCGGNGMGFYNLDAGLLVCGFPPPRPLEPGPMTLITHSGSVFGALIHHDARFRYNLAVSAGQEIATTTAQYLDYALDQETTKVAGLFLETVRDPDRFVAALAKAQARDIPIVALKVGRTAESAALAVSHSGAVAGNHAAYQAMFRRYGVIEVDTLDALSATMLLLAQPRRVARGGLATMHDSGGEREWLVDRTAVHKVPFARIAPETTAKLAARLDPGLAPINPLDAWGTGHDFEGVFRDCMKALLDDPDTAIGALFVELRDDAALPDGYGKAMLAAAAQSDKPVIVASNVSWLGSDALAQRLTRDGLPCLNGGDAALAAIKGAFAYRDARGQAPLQPPAPPADMRAKWEQRLRSGSTLAEADGLALLRDYGVPVVPFQVVENSAGAVAAAASIGLPVALKTAMPEIHHKSDVGGVKLRLADAPAVAAAYADLAARLGPTAVVMPMAPKGVELAFGMVSDPQFGSLVMVGAGGTLIELMADRAFALPPFDAAEARRLIDSLALRPLLDGSRGAPPSNIDALCEALARFSVMVADLGDLLQEVDVNPVSAGAGGSLALDALVVPRGAASP
jgi:acetate---CoA ligase (ADP-forming)